MSDLDLDLSLFAIILQSKSITSKMMTGQRTSYASYARNCRIWLKPLPPFLLLHPESRSHLLTQFLDLPDITV